MSNESKAAKPQLKTIFKSSEAIGFSKCKQRVAAMIRDRATRLNSMPIVELIFGSSQKDTRAVLDSLRNEILELKERD